MTDLRMSEPNNYKRFCCWMVRHLMSYSKLLPQQWIKEVYVRSSHSQSAFVHYARPFGHCKCFWRPAIRKCHICAVLGRYVTARQTVTEWILQNTVHRLFDIFCVNQIYFEWHNTLCNPLILELYGHSHCIVILGLSGSTITFHILINGKVLGNRVLKIKCVYRLSLQLFVWNISNSKKKWVKYYRKCTLVYT
jgi:hypothetical protein